MKGWSSVVMDRRETKAGDEEEKVRAKERRT